MVVEAVEVIQMGTMTIPASIPADHRDIETILQPIPTGMTIHRFRSCSLSYSSIACPLHASLIDSPFCVLLLLFIARFGNTADLC